MKLYIGKLYPHERNFLRYNGNPTFGFSKFLTYSGKNVYFLSLYFIKIATGKIKFIPESISVSYEKWDVESINNSYPNFFFKPEKEFKKLMKRNLVMGQ